MSEQAFEKWWETYADFIGLVEPIRSRRRNYAKAAYFAATERAAGIAMDLCELVDIGAKQPCGRCTPCHVAQKIRGEHESV